MTEEIDKYGQMSEKDLQMMQVADGDESDDKDLQQQSMIQAIKTSDLISETQRETLVGLAEQDPSLIDFETKAEGLGIPREVLAEFQADRKRLIEKLMESTEAHAKEWFNENFPEIQNKEEAIAASAALERRIIASEGQKFIDGDIENFDLSRFTITAIVAKYGTPDAEEEAVVKLEVSEDEKTADSDSDLVSEEKKQTIESAKEHGEYHEESIS